MDDDYNRRANVTDAYGSNPISCRDDQSNIDSTTFYGKATKSTIGR